MTGNAADSLFEAEELVASRSRRLESARSSVEEQLDEVGHLTDLAERLDRRVKEHERALRILAHPEWFPDLDPAPVADRLDEVAAHAEDALEKLPFVEQQLDDAERELAAFRKRVKKRGRKLDVARGELDAVQRLVAAAELAQRRRRVNRYVIGVPLAVIAVVGGFIFMNWFYDFSERRPGLSIAVAAGATLLVVGVLAILRYRDDKSSLFDVGGAFAALGWVAVFVVLPALGGPSRHDHGTLADYCHYGAVSDAQFDGCMEHASADSPERLDTNAARFARRELEACLVDAGPFCEDALRYRLLNDQRPGPGQ